MSTEQFRGASDFFALLIGNHDDDSDCCVDVRFPQSPPKGATIPYRPKLVMTPMIVAGGQAFAVQGQYVVPQQDVSSADAFDFELNVLRYSLHINSSKLLLDQSIATLFVCLSVLLIIFLPVTVYSAQYLSVCLCSFCSIALFLHLSSLLNSSLPVSHY